MTNIQKIHLPWTTVWSETTVAHFIPVTSYMDASDVSKLRATIEMRNRSGNLQVYVAYEIGQVDSTPDTYIVFSSLSNSNGMTYPNGGYQDNASSIGVKRLIRLGFEASLSAGSTLALGRVRADVDIERR